MTDDACVLVFNLHHANELETVKNRKKIEFMVHIIYESFYMGWPEKAKSEFAIE